MKKGKDSFYNKYIKRIFDFLLSLCALCILSPLMLVFTIVGAFKMNGNPFFTQERPGKDERIFKLIKFRTMTNEKDENGDLLSDEDRLIPYGKWLRSTSIDELPELINILKGDMAIVGPRPLLVQYLPLYSAEQKHRHDVRPGLTGWAQVNGRNGITWSQRFKLDLEYIDNITLINDIRIILMTVSSVLKHEGISSATSDTMEDFIGTN